MNPTAKYDIIGDIHGHATELVELLTKLGYTEQSGCFRHPNRKVVFCGDFIDRGPHIPDVVRIAKAMVQHESALAVMGNHEFNALAFHTSRGPGEFFRSHNTRNVRQHAATVDQFEAHELKSALDWFATLPPAVDLGCVRVVHACWSPADITNIQNAISEFGAYTADFLKHATTKHHPLYNAIECVMKGPEMALPEGMTVPDKEGNRRKRVRIRWFEEPHRHTMSTYALPKQASLKYLPVAGVVPAVPYPADAPPVFIGHYWLPEDTPSPLTHNVVCVDYSVAKQGLLCAYRFDGEASLSPHKFVSVRGR